MKRTILALVFALALACGCMGAWAENGDALVGVFHGADDSYSKLRILPSGDGYAVTLDIYRLVGLEFEAEYRDDALRGEAEIQDAFAATVEIRSAKGGPEVTVAASDWELLPAGTVIGFLPGAPDMDPETFSYLFGELCTGYAGTAGASLKAAEAASALLETAVSGDAAYCDLDRLTEAVSQGKAALSDDARAELEGNLPGIMALVESAFSDYGSVQGQFEDAGVDTDVSFSLSAPLAFDDWRTLSTALAMAR